MNDDSLGGSSGSDSDDFLREVARAPRVDAPLPEPDLSGKKLGKYEVGARLGEGGMGVVYEATDTVLMRKVAFKVLARKLLRDEQGRARLLREARSLAAVSHANIAAIYEVAEADGHVFIAMERVHGQTLRDALAVRGRFPPAEARRVVVEMARALAHAHQAGVVHRDLKPENVMLTPGGEVKILDFGLAKAHAPSESGSGGQLTSTVEGHVVGTPSYMSPEQARGQRVDGRSDLFAVGAIFYELLSGQRAFSGGSVVEVLAAVDRDPPRPLRQATPEVSVELERTVLRCLEKSPEARFKSASELVEALDGRAPLTARPGSPARRWVGAGLVTLALAAGGFWALQPRPNPLAAPEAVLACPQLEASGVPQPSGWLGAAAAGLACERAGMARWTQDAFAVLQPAALLDYPVVPSDQLPADPFGGPDDRARAVEAAKRRGAAWLDGKVSFENNAFKVRLVLKAPDGAVLAQGEGGHRAMHEAVRLAMEPLWGPHALAMAPKYPPLQATIRGTDSPLLGLAMLDYETAVMAQTNVDEAWARIEPHQAALGEQMVLARHLRDRLRGVEPQKAEVPIDRSSPQRFALSAGLHFELGNPIDPRAIADELAAMVKSGLPPLVRRLCAEAEARLRLAAGQNEQAVNVALASLAEHGQTDAWYSLLMSQRGRPGYASAALAYAAWRPQVSDSWNAIALMKDPAVERKILMVERAALLSPDAAAPYAVNLGVLYQLAGKLDAARLLGARLLASPLKRSQMTGEVVLQTAEAGEARFRAALDRSHRVLSQLDRLGAIEAGEDPLVRQGAVAAALLGESEPFAELIYQRFVAPEPVRLDRGPWGVTVVASACAFGARPVATACLERLQALAASGYFRDLTPMHLSFLEGAGHFARGDPAKAAASFRKGALGSAVYNNLIPETFDRLGDDSTSAAIDRPMLEVRLLNGASPAHVREARRALKAGDHARARAMAEKVIAAWSVADDVVPAVAEMRALLKTLPPAP